MAHEYRDMPASGTLLEIMIGYAYAEIPGATDITWDGYSRAVRNPTHLQSPAVVKKPGLANYGQIKATVWFDPNDATHQALRDRMTLTAPEYSAALDQFRITYADGFPTPANAEVEGFVSDFSQSMTDPETGTASCSLTIEVTEIVDFTDGSPPE